LDVGQGDGIYIATGDGTRYFIDGGSSDEKNLGKYTLLPFLKSNRINRIDYWFVSHADGDHISGLMEVLESGYEISTLLVSAEAPEDENLHALLSLAKECGVMIQYMKAGDVIRTKHTQMKCLYPFTEMEQRYPRLAEDKNEMSLVLEYYSANVKPGGFYGLFCGDISTEVEKLLVKEGMLKDVDLFKANHHGSKYSNGEVFLQEIKPEFVVISCGAGNRYGHPAPEAIHRMEAVGTEIFYTMEGGQIDLLLVQ
jgi:competence protein ComEC